MNTKDQRKALESLMLDKWDIAGNPVVCRNLQAEILRDIGVTDPANLDLRVKWVNALRRVVARRCPLNKMGTPVVSDIDIMLATPEEHAEAILKLTKRWKEDA